MCLNLYLMIDNKLIHSPARRRSGRLIVIVSRDEIMVSRVKHNLSPEGFQILVIPDYTDIFKIARSRNIRMIITDQAVDHPDEAMIFRALHHKYNCPILAIVHRPEHEVEHFINAGIDDYVFDNGDEVAFMEHIRALLMRHGVHVLKHRVEESNYFIKDICINPLSREVKRGNEELNLTSIEFDILLALAHKAGLIVSRNEIHRLVWGDNAFYNERMIDVHINKLRKKIEKDPSQPQLLLSVRGAGYKLNV